MRTPALLTVMLGMLLGYGAMAHGADTVDDTPPLVRVRAPSADIAAVIRDASERSPTFRRLLSTIDATDGLVFVEDGTCGHSVRACLSLSVKVAGPSRLLRIIVDARRPDCQLMADIGHELQHAIELLSDPQVKDMHSAYAFFQREGPTGSDRFETQAALHAGDQVGDECHARRQGVLPFSTQDSSERHIRTTESRMLALMDAGLARSLDDVPTSRRDAERVRCDCVRRAEAQATRPRGISGPSHRRAR
jgi:hypothetical protein